MRRNIQMTKGSIWSDFEAPQQNGRNSFEHMHTEFDVEILSNCSCGSCPMRKILVDTEAIHVENETTRRWSSL